ncbi:MAG: zinc-ribbon domain-containing protein [Wolbachia sp.]
MKIQCNNCSKIYLVPSEKIGKFGSKVKCTNFNHTWHKYLQESDELHTTNIKEKKSWRKSFLVFTTLAFAVVAVLCIAIANPKQMDKMYTKRLVRIMLQ